MKTKQSDDCKLWWERIRLQSKLQELCKRSRNEDLIFVIEYLEKRAHPAWKEPKIDWLNGVEIGHDLVLDDPERFVPPEILYPSVQKLRDKMARIEKENQEKLARGEKLEMDD
tara:strand:- start:137 stop:475 length:339 start_codon:yes stop_codon:yes gene_type:complete